MITKKDLDKEAEIFHELVTDILKNTNANEGHVRDILMWHERGRDEVIKAMRDGVPKAMTEYAHRAIEEATKEAVNNIGYDMHDNDPTAARMKQSILKLKEKY